MDRRGIWLSGVMMAGLGALLGLRNAGARLAELTLLTAKFAGGPAPRSLDWIRDTAGVQHRLAAMDGWLAAAALLLAVAVAWRLARLLNPHGTLVAPAAAADRSRPLLQTPLAPPLVRRSFLAAAGTGYLLGGVWALVGMLYENPFQAPPATWGLVGLVFLRPARPWIGLGLASVLAGAALWLLWGEWGVVTPRQARSSSRSGMLLRGLLAGAAAFPIWLLLSPWGQGPIDAVLAAVGLAKPMPWRLALWGTAVGLPAAFFALGLLGHALARPGTARTALVPLSALFLALVGGGEAVFPAAAAGRYDEGRDLAALVGAARQPSSTRAYLIFTPPAVPGPLPGMVSFATIEGLDAGNDSPRRTWAYLRRRQFQCAAADNAFVHLHDCASLQWDSAESLRVDLADLEQHPTPVFAGLLVEKLSTCATSAENRALLRQAADPAYFRSDPQWLRTLGMLNDRFGDRATATELLQQAGLGAEEVRQVLGPAVPLTSGVVTGQIVMNGRSGVGLTAGVLPSNRWQTLVGRQHAFELRWVAAAAPTDADGRFQLRDLAEGDYVLIVMGSTEQLPLGPSGAHAEGSPGLLQLDSTHPTRDLGTIRITTTGTAPATQAANPPPPANHPSG